MINGLCGLVLLVPLLASRCHLFGVCSFLLLFILFLTVSCQLHLLTPFCNHLLIKYNDLLVVSLRAPNGAVDG